MEKDGSSPVTGRDADTQVTTEAETGGVRPELRSAQDGQRRPGWKRRGRIPPRRSEGARPSQHPELRLLAPKLWENEFLLLRPPWLWASVTAALERKTEGQGASLRSGRLGPGVTNLPVTVLTSALSQGDVRP